MRSLPLSIEPRLDTHDTVVIFPHNRLHKALTDKFELATYTPLSVCLCRFKFQSDTRTKNRRKLPDVFCITLRKSDSSLWSQIKKSTN